MAKEVFVRVYLFGHQALLLPLLLSRVLHHSPTPPLPYMLLSGSVDGVPSNKKTVIAPGTQGHNTLLSFLNSNRSWGTEIRKEK